jgi:hypothetical protein
MTTVQPCHRPRLPPSKLAPKILCSAYEPRPFPEGKEGELLRGRHAFAQSWTIKRHLRLSYTLFDIDLPEDGKRIDLVFLSPEGKMRIYEVKSHKQIREVDKIQAALYWSPKYDEVVVSTPDIDLILTIDYIREVRTAANLATSTCRFTSLSPPRCMQDLRQNVPTRNQQKTKLSRKAPVKPG